MIRTATAENRLQNLRAEEMERDSEEIKEPEMDSAQFFLPAAAP